MLFNFGDKVTSRMHLLPGSHTLGGHPVMYCEEALATERGRLQVSRPMAPAEFLASSQPQ